MAKDIVQIDFTWKGKDKIGKIINGEISATSEAIARTELRRQGTRIVRIRKKPKALFSKRKQPITTKDITDFSRQLATMLQSGVPLVQSFDIISKSTENPSMVEMLLVAKEDIEGGGTLSQALTKWPAYFDELFCSLVKVGEQTGDLDSLLDKIATYQEKVATLKNKIKKALTYPIAITVIAVTVAAGMLIYVVPVFKDLFNNFGAVLPGFTLWVMGISDWMVVKWYYLVGSIVAVVYIFKYFKKRSPKFNYFIARMLLRLPIVGVLLHKSSIARFSRTLATMSAAGIPLADALESVAGATGNIVYHRAVMEMRKNIATGQSLQYSITQTHLFPNMVIQMLAIGEESGSMDKMLNKVADFYEEEVDNLVDNLSSLMEPFIMVILGTLVGGLIVAMYLPIFKLGAVAG